MQTQDPNKSKVKNDEEQKKKAAEKDKKAKAPTGSYTNTHESGKKYHGKGSEERAKQSGKRVGDKNDDPVAHTDWTPSANDRQAFKDEDDRMKTDEGGHKSDDNYNERASPGEKYKEQDQNKEPGQMPAVPASVPAGGVTPASNSGLVQKISNVTGLTGTALIIYIVISEGSRLFPPRNLVPIP